MKHLVIISHTEHYITSEGVIVGWGSTVTEINHLLAVFDRITHVAMLHNTVAPPSTMPYTSNRIHFVPLPVVGGPRFQDKLKIVTKAPELLRIIRTHLKQADAFQFRAPTGIGVFVIPYLILFCRKPGWYKYAGNWKQDRAPLSYRWQRWLLKQQSRKVTINGFWKDQPKQCLSFENPCLTQEELRSGAAHIMNRTLPERYTLCFVGRLETAKGIDILIDALLSLSLEDQSRIGDVHLVGDGKAGDAYKKKVQGSSIVFKFHGFLPREAVHAIYKKSHAIVLPSASEGFPKVIAEAMNYGCIPIVSDVSSIGHYIVDGVNGFLLQAIRVDALQARFISLISLEASEYKEFICSNSERMESFTYTFYNKRLMNSFIND